MLRRALRCVKAYFADNYGQMKILIVCQFFYPEKFSINDVAASLARRGHDVLVVTGRPNYGYNQILEGYEHVTDEVYEGVRVHRCSLKARKKGRMSIIENYLSFWMSSKRYLRRLKEEFDVVYSMSLSPLISIVGGTIYARKHHVRHVLHCLDLWPESTVVTGAVKKGSLMYRVLFRWCRKIYSNLDEILISSPSFLSYFREELKVKNVKVSYVPQPPQTAEPEEKVAYSHKANFVYAGNIGTLQLVESLVMAMAKIPKEEDIGLHLIGMGSREAAVNELIVSLGLEDRVHFYGIKARTVTAGFYENATGIVVSLKEGGTVGKTIPSKLNSSLYYGRPILAIIQGDGREVLESAGCAHFSASESPEDIASAMQELAHMDEAKRNALGKNAKQYFADHYETEKVVDQIFDHLKIG